MPLLYALIVGILVVAAVFAFLHIGSPDKSKQIARRLEGNAPEYATVEASATQQLIRDEELSTVPWLNTALSRWSKIGYARSILAQAGMEDTKPGQILLMTIVFAVGGYMLPKMFFGNSVLPVVGMIVLGGFPIASVYYKRKVRLAAFEKNFAEAIDLLGRAVRAGHGLNTGIEIVGQEMTEPISGEFRKTFEEQHLGLHFRETLVNLTQRVPLQDVRFFAAALIIQDETGGNLAEILGNLSATIRDRFKIRGEVRVKTAQGRLTAAILMCLPPGMLLLLHFLNPQYLDVLFTDIYGLFALAGAACLQIIGALILWKIVNIEV